MTYNIYINFENQPNTLSYQVPDTSKKLSLY